ncbi:MAG: MBL fold metallo-hydrolase [Casimicrobiaceae bacterium]
MNASHAAWRRRRIPLTATAFAALFACATEKPAMNPHHNSAKPHHTPSGFKNHFGSFDLAALPIGAYAPRWFMQTQHVNSVEAVQIHGDLHARQSLAVHWGTFVLTDEPLDEPPQQLAAALDAQRIARDSFWVFMHGETRTLAPATRVRRAAD